MSGSADEPSGSHAQPQMHIPSPREGGDITINVKTVLAILAFLAGGGVVGGGLSIGSGHGGPEATAALERLTSRFDSMELKLTQIQAQMQARDGHDGEVVKRIDDHEDRIRALEQARRPH